MSAFAGSASTDRARAREWLDYSGARYYGKNKNWNKHLVCYTVHVQHLMAGREKEGAESLQIRLCNLNICIEKVDAKCWLAEIWELSQWGATEELEEQFTFQKCSCKLSFLFLPRHQSASESLLAGYGNLVCSFLHSLTGAVTEHASLT